MTEKPEVLKEIQKNAGELIRKWGPRDVLVILSRKDYGKINRYASKNPEASEEPEGPSFSLNFQSTMDLSEGDFILSVEEKDDERDGGLIEI